MQKSKIEWTDYTWNPIKGICPVGCWYCYARKMYKRFKWDEKPRVEHEDIYGELFPKKPSRIFVCSTFELFHPSIHKMIRDVIFTRIEQNPQHTFQILTKLPQNIDRPMPENVWLGVSITGEDNTKHCYRGLLDAKAKVKFISFEPILRPMFLMQRQIDWVIMGRLTGHGHKYDPSPALLDIMIRTYICNKTPIFLKDNLTPLLGQKLVSQYQEWPE